MQLPSNSIHQLEPGGSMLSVGVVAIKQQHTVHYNFKLKESSQTVYWKQHMEYSFSQNGMPDSDVYGTSFFKAAKAL